jgi:hypothetical protein
MLARGHAGSPQRAAASTGAAGAEGLPGRGDQFPSLLNPDRDLAAKDRGIGSGSRRSAPAASATVEPDADDLTDPRDTQPA